MTDSCIFCRIGAGQITVEAVFEDEHFIAFPDMHPQAPVHVLLIPKQHFATIMEMDDPVMLSRAMAAVQQTASALGLVDEGFRTVLNTRDNGGQTVYHVHWHILGGRFMQWPPG